MTRWLWPEVWLRSELRLRHFNDRLWCLLLALGPSVQWSVWEGEIFNIWSPLGVDGDVSEPSSLDHLVRSWPREGQLVKYRVSGPRSAGLGRAKVVWQVVGGRTDWFRWARSGLQYVDGWTSVSLLDHGQPRDHTVKLPLKTIIHSPQSQLSPTPVSVSISTESACLTRVSDTGHVYSLS